MAFVKLAETTDFEDIKMKIVETKFFRVGIFKNTDTYIAFEDVCTHDGEPISEGELDDCILTCPRHFAQFDLKTGEALCMPATEPIKLFPVRVNRTDIEVDLED
ncbi:MAG: non-heme iron oxygenase ferredoxin subunit [Leptospiraceae bacterium]|nr:non-heme iron oxygenase ferredoxin subunit [Leptospiraceae bacterium]